MKTALHTLILALVIATNSNAANIYVNNVAGDDRNDGVATESIAKSGPVRTIAKALRLAEAGDQIILANTGENYLESITLQGGNHSGRFGRPFAIIGNGATIDGSFAVPDDAWGNVKGNVFRFRPKRLHFQQLLIDGKPAPRIDAPKTKEKMPNFRTTVGATKGTEGHWCLYQGHIYFHVADGKPPQSYKARYCHYQVGVTMYQVHDVAVVDLNIIGFQQDGVNAHDGVFNGYLAGLSCKANGRSGISIGGASRVEIEACLLQNNGVVELRTEGYCQAKVTKCDIVGEKVAKYQVTGGKLSVDGKLIPKDKK